MTETAIQCADVDQLTAVSLSVVLVAVKTVASTLQAVAYITLRVQLKPRDS